MKIFKTGIQRIHLKSLSNCNTAGNAMNSVRSFQVKSFAGTYLLKKVLTNVIFCHSTKNKV